MALDDALDAMVARSRQKLIETRRKNQLGQ